MTQQEAIDKALKKHETNCCMFERGVQTLDDLLASRTVFLGVLQAAQAQAAVVNCGGWMLNIKREKRT